jgi:hypothetical protein
LCVPYFTVKNAAALVLHDFMFTLTPESQSTIDTFLALPAIQKKRD